MYRRKKSANTCKMSRKPIALLVCLLLLLVLTVGGTLAFVFDTTGALQNLFLPSQVTTKVEETRSDGVKSDVFIRNTGDTVAWIRAAVVITWQNEAGHVYGKAPVAGTDYDIVWGSGWITGSDEFYYWPSPVEANGGTTGDLIESCTYKANAPEGYFLNVEIVGSGIQSSPAAVFHNAWASSGLVVDDSNKDSMLWTLKKNS